mgnify:CR=1 FL=1
MQSLSVVIPAKNEEQGLAVLLPRLIEFYPEIEIIVVDDGSEDSTVKIAQDLGVSVISHPYSQGNGAAIKTGARHASGDLICFMDADGQHDPADIGKMLEELETKKFDMVVGARDTGSQASLFRGIGNGFYNRFASLIVGQKVEDLTSGYRLVRAGKFREFLSLLPNKFSYPTTITMAFFRSGYTVGYLPIKAARRLGKSHLRIWRDGIRFLLIIFKVGTLYSPLKIFLPIALLHFILGIGYYTYTFITVSRFTNMSALLLTSSIVVFLMGLISEQITTLTYSRRDDQ